MGVWEWVTAVLAIWGAVSILTAVAWALVGKRIFRRPPAPPRLVHGDGSETEFSAALRRRAGER